jgi:hypothetical protein
MLIWATTDALLATRMSLYELARNVRESIEYNREDDVVAATSARIGARCRAVVDQNHALDATPGPRRMTINSSMQSVISPALYRRN